MTPDLLPLHDLKLKQVFLNMQCLGEGEVKALYIASIMLRLPVELFSSCNVFGTGRFTCCMNPKTSTVLNNIEQFGFE